MWRGARKGGYHIIGDNAYFSFAAEGLIGEYELDFLSLKARGASR